MKPDQEQLLSRLHDANNLLWKFVSDILKTPWEASAEQKRAVLSRLAKVSDSVALTELLLREAFVFLYKGDHESFLQETATERVEELARSLSSSK